jgi:phospholipase/lecithinase/hemolysin
VSTHRIAAIAFTSLLAINCAPPTAGAGPFSQLVVFGDSLSDIGNISQAFFGAVPGPYYSSGRFSNGPVYVQTLATELGLPAATRSTAGGNDFAYGGARTSGTGGFEGLFIRDIDEQVDQYLESRTASASALYLIFAGANDLIAGQTNVSVPVNNLSHDMGRLYTAGARSFLVLNLPPLGYTPRYNGNPTTLAQANSRAQQYNAALDAMLAGFETSHAAAAVYRFDVEALFRHALANPASYNFENVTNSAAPGLQPGDGSYDTGQIAPNPNQYVFWDDLHPTSSVHLVLAHRILDLFFPPGDYNRDAANDAADFVTWRNGAGNTYVSIDYEIWRANFGSVSSGVATDRQIVVVPEPKTLGVVLGGVIMVTIFTRRREL